MFFLLITGSGVGFEEEREVEEVLKMFELGSNLSRRNVVRIDSVQVITVVQCQKMTK